MQKTKKQRERDALVSGIKSTLPKRCLICGRSGPIEAAHILPRSTSPEHYTNPANIIPACHDCHTKLDNDKTFRQSQGRLYLIAKEIDELAAYRRFRK